MDSVTMLTKPPFDKPLSFTRLFDKKMQMEIMAAINKVKDNAVVIAAWESVQHQFNDYNVTDSRKPHKTREPRRRIALQRGSLYAGTAEKPYFKRFSGIEKCHRNSIKITVDLWSEWRGSTCAAAQATSGWNVPPARF